MSGSPQAPYGVWLLRRGALLTPTGMFTGAGNYVFQMIIGRRLLPEDLPPRCQAVVNQALAGECAG